MTKIEYWDMGSSIFSKTTKDGIIEGTESKPKEEWPENIIKGLAANHGYMVSNDDKSTEAMFKEAEEEQEQLSKNETSLTQEELDNTLKTMEDVKLTKNTKATESAIETNSVKNIRDDTVSNNDKNYDFVSHPAHYNGHIIKTSDGDFTYETIQYLEALVRRLEKDLYADESGSVYCAAKYMDRIGGGKPDGNKTVREKIAEDCQKIGWYMNHCADLIKKNGFEPKHFDKDNK